VGVPSGRISLSSYAGGRAKLLNGPEGLSLLMGEGGFFFRKVGSDCGVRWGRTQGRVAARSYVVQMGAPCLSWAS
jgi:hypothetical protein